MRHSLVVATALLAGCIGYRRHEPASVEWPTALLAQWREAGADPHDTTMLAIGRGGFLDVQRTHVRVENGRAVVDVWSDERLRWWTEPVRPGEAAGPRQFCFTSRPGRGHSCVLYRIDTRIQPDGVARRTLTLAKLGGRSPAVLVAR